MTHSLKNIKSQEALSNKLMKALSESRIVSGLLMVWDKTFDGFRNEALKSVSQWMSATDIDEVAYKTYLSEAGSGLQHAAQATKLNEILNEKGIEKLCAEIIQELASIPKQYEIYFPLPSAPPITVKLSPHVRIIPDNRNSVIAGIAPVSSALVVSSRGYGSDKRNQTAVREAISYVKVALAIGELYGTFIKSERQSLGLLSFFEVETTKNETLHYAYVSESSGHKKENRVLLGLGLSKYLNELTFKSDPSSKEFKKNIAQVVDMIHLMYEPAAEENIHSIRRALEWSFDAVIDEDETTRFIKTCIGLEAAVSDQSEGMGITEQLADRTAFLLRKTPKAREQTRAIMRDIYKLRSKIVHGNLSGLSHTDVETANLATFTLSSILKVELNAVSTWWLTQHIDDIDP
jgi:hypothetical protein